MRKPPIPGITPNERPLHSESAAIGPPRLLWPSMYTNDATHFPMEGDVRGRRTQCLQGDAIGLVAFEVAVMEAHRRLLVLDPHFDEVGVKSFRDALDYSQVVEVRLLTERSAADVAPWRKELEWRINLNRTDRRMVEVQWRKWKGREFPFLHDRFAVVDDALWHFGATVGGGHAGVNAASGPWSAADARAVDFFAECWRHSRA